jgi:DNA-binding beta-propeller fold protein YncE
LITENGTIAFDELVGMPVGTYRLRADAEVSLNQGGGEALFDIDFRRVCSSPDPLDSDGDDFVDACDVCPLDFDPDQADADGDGIGDACNDAVDGDGDDYADALDNCPADPNPDQMDADFDTRGDVCDDPEVITQILDPEGLTIANPMRVALAADGTVYVAAASTSNVFQISPAGDVVELFRGGPLGAHVSDVAVSPDGFVYTAGGAPAKCYEIDPETGAATLVIGPQGDGQGALLEYADRVVVADDGRVFVSGRDSQNVFEVATDGTILEVLDASGNGATPLGRPDALDVDAAGNLYVLGTDNSMNPRVFRVAPDHQVELLMSNLPPGSQGYDMALGPDGSIYVGANGISVRRPSGQIEFVLPNSDPRYAYALDVDFRGVVHVVQEYFGSGAFRITPTGQIGGLMDASGDGLGHPLTAASDVAVADGPHKRIVIVARQSRNAFLVADATPVPLFGPISLGLLAVAMLMTPAISRRRWQRSSFSFPTGSNSVRLQ